MARARAKRASRPNPREDRNLYVEEFQPRKPINLIPKNISQEEYIDALENPKARIVFAVGPAGTGKTMLATLAAVREFEAGKIKKIVITRPNVAVDDNPIGHLPGDILGKMTPWMMPILDHLKEVYSPKEVENMIKNEVIEICPIAFMRGRTFKNAWVIVDEAQGTKSKDTLKAILTRIGEGSKMVVTGDIKQSDFEGSNGLEDFVRRYKPTESIAMITFRHRDIERDEVVKKVLAMYGEQ